MSELFSNDRPMDKATEFVEMFKRVKSEKKGRKSILKGLNKKDEDKLRALVKRGYKMDEIELAVRAMFDDPEQWAVNKEQDIPTHFLNQFDRYAELAMREQEKKERKKAEPETPEQKEKKQEQEQEAEWLKLSMEEYSTALRKGDWGGSILDAVRIGKFFRNEFTPGQKAEFFKLAVAKAADVKDKRTGETTMAAAIALEISTPENLFCEIVVVEAVKRKIPEPWKG